MHGSHYQLMNPAFEFGPLRKKIIFYEMHCSDRALYMGVSGFILHCKVMLYFPLIIIKHPSLSSISDASPCRQPDLYLHD